MLRSPVEWTFPILRFQIENTCSFELSKTFGLGMDNFQQFKAESGSGKVSRSSLFTEFFSFQISMSVWD